MRKYKANSIKLWRWVEVIRNFKILSWRFSLYATSAVLIVQSNLSLYLLYCAEACYESTGPISASLRPGNTAPFGEMSQQWRPVGTIVFDLTGPRFEPQTSRSRDESVPLDQHACSVLIVLRNITRHFHERQ